jgi:hypothetical protein
MLTTFSIRRCLLAVCLPSLVAAGWVGCSSTGSRNATGGQDAEVDATERSPDAQADGTEPALEGGEGGETGVSADGGDAEMEPACQYGDAAYAQGSVRVCNDGCNLCYCDPKVFSTWAVGSDNVECQYLDDAGDAGARCILSNSGRTVPSGAAWSCEAGPCNTCFCDDGTVQGSSCWEAGTGGCVFDGGSQVPTVWYPPGATWGQGALFLPGLLFHCVDGSAQQIWPWCGDAGAGCCLDGTEQHPSGSRWAGGNLGCTESCTDGVIQYDGGGCYPGEAGGG